MCEKSSVTKWLHLGLTVLLAGALGTLAILILADVIEIRLANRNDPGCIVIETPRIQRVTEPNDFLRLVSMNDKAYFFKYEGAWIDCWIDVEVDGKKSKLHPRLGEDVRHAAEGLSNADPSGYLALVQRTQNGAGVCDLVLSFTKKDGDQHGAIQTKITLPLPDAKDQAWSVSLPKIEGSFADGHEVALLTFFIANKKGVNTRSCTLMCKAMK